MTNQITLRKSPTELYKILKFEGMVSSGAEAKLVIDNGLVKVNNKIETRKRNKIVAGDTIEFAGELYLISDEEGARATNTPSSDHDKNFHGLHD